MRSKGFTLIEVMIVIAIISILTSVVLPAYQEHQGNGKSITDKENVEKNKIKSINDQ